MGIFDFLTSMKRPEANTPVLSPQEVRDKLLSLNRPTSPFHIIDSLSESIDLILEWKIVNAKWYEIFDNGSLTKVFRIYLKLDPNAHVVRAVDREYTITWTAGVPKLSLLVSAFRG